MMEENSSVSTSTGRGGSPQTDSARCSSASGLRPRTKGLEALLVLIAMVAFVIGPAAVAAAASRHPARTDRRDRFDLRGLVEDEDAPTFDPSSPFPADAAEAPTGFDNLSNGFTEQGPPFASLDEDTVVPLRSFNDDRFLFEEVEKIADGLGPVYNAQSCRECHQSVVTGGSSQVAEHRTGHLELERFFESIGGSLIQSRATHPDIVEHVSFADDIRTFRASTSTLGDGFVESIANSTLLAIRNRQPARMRGTALPVAVLEANGQARIGRFGWKSQHASLESFAADAYVNEMGITSPLFPEENTSSGMFVGFGTPYDPVPEPEDDGTDVVAFADFMRSTKAPSRGPITADVEAGEQWFADVGCAVCHVPSIVTARPGTSINGGTLIVPEALGSKIIHPYSDYLLHDIGTGDGIPVLPTAEMQGTANQIRTAPLWGLRTRNRFLHDSLTATPEEAILRHAGQARDVVDAYRRLPAAKQRQLLAFLASL